MAHAPVPSVGRETLVRVVERWARKGNDKVTLVFDGPVPRGGLAKQMTSPRVLVKFSRSVTADDVIIEMVHRSSRPGTIRVVTSDTAVRHEAKHRRCRHTDSVTFVGELFAPQEGPPAPAPPEEKPGEVSAQDREQWLELFDIDHDDPGRDYDRQLPDDIDALGD